MKHRDIVKQIVTALIIFSVSYLIVFNIIPNFIRARFGGHYTGCQGNTKNIGTALEMYSTDNNGEYPESMKLLIPNYIKTIPTCPAAQKDTYSHYYRSSKDHKHYTFFCEGENHRGLAVPDNYPQYDSTAGTRPR